MSVRSEIEVYTQKLLRFFHAYRREFPLTSTHSLMDAWEQEKVAEMVSVLSKHMGIGCDLRLSLVKDDFVGLDAPAWTEVPKYFPFIDTAEYRTTEVTIFVRKSALDTWQFDSLIVALAHELSHIVLESFQQGFEKVEEAVDITAIILGFGRFYIRGSYVKLLSPIVADNGEQWIMEEAQLGYLSREEIRWVAEQL